MVETNANSNGNTSSVVYNDQPKKLFAKGFIEGLFADDDYFYTLKKPS